MLEDVRCQWGWNIWLMVEGLPAILEVPGSVLSSEGGKNRQWVLKEHKQHGIVSSCCGMVGCKGPLGVQRYLCAEELASRIRHQILHNWKVEMGIRHNQGKDTGYSFSLLHAVHGFSLFDEALKCGLSLSPSPLYSDLSIAPITLNNSINCTVPSLENPFWGSLWHVPLETSLCFGGSLDPFISGQRCCGLDVCPSHSYSKRNHHLIILRAINFNCRVHMDEINELWKRSVGPVVVVHTDRICWRRWV